MFEKIKLSGQILWQVLLVGIVCGVLGFLFLTYIYFTLPDVEQLSNYEPPIPSQILSRDGHVLWEIGAEKRELAKIEEIPEKLIGAFLAAEDDNFYNHSGVDYYGIFRAFIANIKAGGYVQGGSTITQQVAKSLLLSREKAIIRKLKDFLLAQRIEKKFSKQEILYLYLNQIYLGGGYYGVKAAAKGYFGKELSEISAAESAMIAGLLVAPSKYSPYVNPDFAKYRQKYVLKRMYETSKISEDEYQKALVEPLVFRRRVLPSVKAGYFSDWVRQRVTDLVGAEKLKTDGLKIVTTLDFELQQVAEKAVLNGAKEIDKRQGFNGPIKFLDTEEKILEEEQARRKRYF